MNFALESGFGKARKVEKSAREVEKTVEEEPGARSRWARGLTVAGALMAGVGSFADFAQSAEGQTEAPAVEELARVENVRHRMELSLKALHHYTEGSRKKHVDFRDLYAMEENAEGRNVGDALLTMPSASMPISDVPEFFRRLKAQHEAQDKALSTLPVNIENVKEEVRERVLPPVSPRTLEVADPFVEDRARLDVPMRKFINSIELTRDEHAVYLHGDDGFGNFDAVYFVDMRVNPVTVSGPATNPLDLGRKLSQVRTEEAELLYDIRSLVVTEKKTVEPIRNATPLTLNDMELVREHLENRMKEDIISYISTQTR